MTEQEPAGRIKHQPDCPCKVCKSVRTADARRQAEAEESATVRAVARTLVKLMSRGALSGPDALRNLVGPDDALRVLRAAGMSPGQAAASWEAAAPVQQAQSPGATAALWAASPDHDPRVVHALVHGASDGEIATVRAQVAGEYRQRAAAKAQREDAYYGRDRAPAGMGVPVDENGIPAQRSVVHRDVPPLGTEA